MWRVSLLAPNNHPPSGGGFKNRAAEAVISRHRAKRKPVDMKKLTPLDGKSGANASELKQLLASVMDNGTNIYRWEDLGVVYTAHIKPGANKKTAVAGLIQTMSARNIVVKCCVLVDEIHAKLFAIDFVNDVREIVSALNMEKGEENIVFRGAKPPI